MTLRRNPPPRSEDRRSYRKSLPAVRLYLDDVDDLVRFLRERCEVVSIMAGNAEAEEAEDLRDAKPKELKQVRIVTQRPAMVVDLGNRFPSIWGPYAGWPNYGDADKAEDPQKIRRDLQRIFDDAWNLISEHRIYRILDGIRRKTAEAMLLILAATVLWVVVMLNLVEDGKATAEVQFPEILWFVPMLALLALAMYRMMRFPASVIPERRKERRLLNRETRDKALWFVAGVVVTGVVTAVQIATQK